MLGIEVTQLGHLGAQPEMRYLPSGDPVANFRVASTSRWKDRDTGEEKERTTWLPWTVYGSQADNAAKLLQKGSRVLVRGTIRNESWEKDGETVYQDRYVVEFWQLLDRKPKDEADPAAAPASQAPASPDQSRPAAKSAGKSHKPGKAADEGKAPF